MSTTDDQLILDLMRVITAKEAKREAEARPSAPDFGTSEMGVMKPKINIDPLELVELGVPLHHLVVPAPTREHYLFQVARIDWYGHTPRGRWVTLKRWLKPPTAERLRDLQLKALEMPRFFTFCEHCGERNHVDYMSTDALCQPCAENHFGYLH